MATFKLYTNRLNSYGPHSYSVALDLSGRDGNIEQTVEAKNVRELQPLFDAFTKEAEATGRPLMVSVTLANRRDRKPPGFDKARERRGSLCAFVNTDKCLERAI